MKNIATLIFVSFLIFVSACSKKNIPNDLEKDASIATTAWLENRYGFINNRSVSTLTNRIKNKLTSSIFQTALNADQFEIDTESYRNFSWNIFVLNSKEPYAFATGSGIIFITKGLILSTKEESELAAIIAHEMSHEILGHIDDAIEEHGLSARAPQFIFNLEQEIEADALSLNILEVARYNTRAAVSALTLAYGNKDSFAHSEENGWLQTRISQLRNTLKRRVQYPATRTTREYNRVKKELASLG